MGARKLTLQQVEAMIAEASASNGDHWQDLASRYGVAVSTVYHILTRHSWYRVPRVFILPETPIQRGAARWKRGPAHTPTER